MAERAAAIAAAATLSAACGTAQDGGPYVATDPVVPPAGSGGNAGVGTSAAGSGGLSNWGAAGYGVVDPLPPPSYCPAPLALTLSVTNAHWETSQAVFDVQAKPSAQTFASITVQAATAQAPASAKFSGSEVRVSSANWPAAVVVDITFGCMNSSGTISYQFRVQLDTSHPGASGSVPFQILTS